MVTRQKPSAADARTYSLVEAIDLVGCGRSTGYNEAKTKGEFAGVKVIKIGVRYFVPKAALDRVLSGNFT